MINGEKSWSDAKNSGIYSSIKSIDQYNDICEAGIEKGVRFLNKLDTDKPHSSSTLRKVHGLMFEDVAPWAGSTSDVQMAFGGKTGAPPKIMRDEMNLADSQINEMWKKVRTPCDKMSVVAFTHMREVNIHPFRDGNGRSTRAILESNIDNLFGRDCAPIERAEYFKALNVADSGNLAPLVKLLAESANIEMAIPNSITPDYNMWARQEDQKLSLDEGLKLTRNGKNDFRNHEVVSQDKKWLSDLTVNRPPVSNEHYKPMKLGEALEKIDQAFEPKGVIEKIFPKNLLSEKHQAKAVILKDFIEIASPEEKSALVNMVVKGDNKKLEAEVSQIDQSNPLVTVKRGATKMKSSDYLKGMRKRQAQSQGVEVSKTKTYKLV